MGKLVYDKEKLEFVEVKSSSWDYLKKGLWFFVVSIGLSVLYYVIFALILNTGNEKKILLENKTIESEYGALIEKTELLDGVLENIEYRDRNIYKDVFNTEPTSFFLEIENSDLFAEDLIYSSTVIDYTKEKILVLESKVAHCRALLDDIESELKRNTQKSNMSMPSIIPVANFSLLQTGATVGEKVHPYYKTLVMHNGIDLITPKGTDVLAAAQGKVISVTRLKKGSGNSVKIDHGNGYVTTYSHLADILVRKGNSVKQGRIIGRVGDTGMAFAPHLHYEVIYKGEYRDPVNYFFAKLDPSTYREMMMIAVNTGQSLD